MDSNILCTTSNYVIIETLALLQSSIRIYSVRGFQADLIPVLHIVWVDTGIHNATGDNWGRFP